MTTTKKTTTRKAPAKKAPAKKTTVKKTRAKKPAPKTLFERLESGPAGTPIRIANRTFRCRPSSANSSLISRSASTAS